MKNEIKEIIAERIKYHSNKQKYGYFIGNGCIDICASDILDDVIRAGYRKQSETITFYKDPNIKDWAESEYAWCERPCDSNMSMLAIDKKGSIVGYASEHYWTWCDVKEVKKVSAIEFMQHFASKQSETVKEFAQKAISRVFVGITQRFCDCYNDGLLRGYPDSELSWNFFRAFNECKDIAKKEINDLAEQYGKEE